MSEFQLNKNNYNKILDWAIELLNEGPFWIVEAKNPAIGKWTMTRLWRSWMGSTGKFMADRGVNMLIVNSDDICISERPFDQNDAHELFTNKYLQDGRGKRLSWSKKGRDDMRQATRGERVFAMQQHQAWMVDKGIKHMNPKDSDYMRAIHEQDK